MERTEHYHFAGSKKLWAVSFSLWIIPRFVNSWAKFLPHYPDEVIPKIKFARIARRERWFLVSLATSALGTNESIIREFFPVFTNPEGRSFDRSAHSIWDALLNNDMQEDGFLMNPRKSFFLCTSKWLDSQVEPVFRKLKEKHKRFHDEKKPMKEGISKYGQIS